MRIVFMGTPSYATSILKALLHVKRFEVVALFTQPDKPVGRKKILTPPNSKAFLQNEGFTLPIFQPKNLKDTDTIQTIKELKPDFIVVAAYGQILTQDVLDICPCINLHASLLPKYRGASPIQSAILENESFSGVTAMRMDKGLDTGDMLGFSYVSLRENTTSEELFNALATQAAKLTIKVLDKFHTLSSLKQVNANSTYAPKIKKEDGKVDIKLLHVKRLWSRFCAFHPWPGLYLSNGVKLIEFSCSPLTCKEEPSTIIKLSQKEVIVCGLGGTISLKTIQPPSKKPMSAYAYLLGQRKKVGDTLY